MQILLQGPSLAWAASKTLPVLLPDVGRKQPLGPSLGVFPSALVTVVRVGRGDRPQLYGRTRQPTTTSWP